MNRSGSTPWERREDFMKRHFNYFAWLLIFAVFGCDNNTTGGISAQPDDEEDATVVDTGELGPLMGMRAGSAHGGIHWKTVDGVKTPFILFYNRHSEYRGRDVGHPEVVEQLIAAGALTNGVQDFTRESRALDVGAFVLLAYGGMPITNSATSTGRLSRFLPEMQREGCQLWDLNHPDAFKIGPTPKFRVEDMTDEDLAANDASFSDAGFSKGLSWTAYCSGGTSLANGDTVHFGGHNMASHNGYRKVGVWLSEEGKWRQRAEFPAREAWADDPHGLDFLKDNPGALFFPGADPLDDDVSDPPDASDMRYGRWYPACLLLPNGRVLVWAGDGQTTDAGRSIRDALALGPNGEPDGGIKAVFPASPEPTSNPYSAADQQRIFDASSAIEAESRTTRVNQGTPEIYDPEEDKCTALENARKWFPNYGRGVVVQTGPGEDDWKVLQHGESLGPKDGGRNDAAGNPDEISTSRRTNLFDVQAAFADPNRDVQNNDDPSGGFYEFIGNANDAHYQSGNASIMRLNEDGSVKSHTFTLFGGRGGRPDGRLVTLLIDQIELAPLQTGGSVSWKNKCNLFSLNSGGESLSGHRYNLGTVLPNLKVLIIGGLDTVNPLDTRYNYQYSLYDPETGVIEKAVVEAVQSINPVTGLEKLVGIARRSHTTTAVVPDGRVLIMGTDRSQTAPNTDVDLGVYHARFYSPPYLFDDDNDLETERPTIEESPTTIGYGGQFEIKLGEESERIKLVTLLKTGFVTHSFNFNTTATSLHFEQSDGGDGDTLTVNEASVPAQALPGDYLLFVVDENGVPSEAKYVQLMLD